MQAGHPHTFLPVPRAKGSTQAVPDSTQHLGADLGQQPPTRHGLAREDSTHDFRALRRSAFRAPHATATWTQQPWGSRRKGRRNGLRPLPSATERKPPDPLPVRFTMNSGHWNRSPETIVPLPPLSCFGFELE